TEELPMPGWSVVLRHNSGEVPIGKLFRITPRADYNGDLVVTVYLTNVSALSKAYRYLNMKIYVEKSEEAAMTSSYRILDLDNGVAKFLLEGLTTDSYSVSIIGGGYSLISADPQTWQEDWVIIPELYAEVSPR
ncbi:MAG: hypothetical protein Q8O43_01760, partial [Dehalococcoidia bacterium]|nr:hypothetical protein [Dehalococcoidia bacterium]